jgi:hypothetical protein
MLLVTVGTILKLVFDGIGRRDICPYLVMSKNLQYGCRGPGA